MVCNHSGSISAVSLALRIVSIWFEPRDDCRSCSLIIRGRVVLKKIVVDNVKVTDVWTTSGRGKVIARLRGALEFPGYHSVIYNQYEENLIIRLKHPCLKTGK